VLCGCLKGPEYKRPTIAIPPAFREQPAGEQISFADQGWWNVYSDPFLSALIKEALKNNYDLKTAIARAKEAEAYLGVARSAFFPSVNVESGSNAIMACIKTIPIWIFRPTHRPEICSWAAFPRRGKLICGAAFEIERGRQRGISRHGGGPAWFDARSDYRGGAGLP